MKILNNTTGNLHFNTTISTGGGDCGDIPAGAPPYDYPINPGTTVSINIRTTQDIQYTDLTNDTFLEVASWVETGPGARK